MAYQCPLCAGVISTTEYWHLCGPLPKPPRESIVHKLMMATVARHKKLDPELDQAKAGYTILRKYHPMPGSASWRRAWENIHATSIEAQYKARAATAHLGPVWPARRWQDNRPATRSTHNP